MKQFPKTDARYWREKLFKRSNEDWNVRMAFAGRQERFPLKTANKDIAAGKARDIYLSLHRLGWDDTLAKFKPWTAQDSDEGKPLTVGKFIEAIRAIAPVRPATFLDYERKLRFMVAQIKSVESTKARHDYFNSGHLEWREKVDKVPLCEITPEKVLQWRVRYINAAGADPLKTNSARQSAASIIRNAKALFSPRLIRALSLKLPTPLPFEGVDLGKRPRTRYKSKVDASALVQAAHNELKKDQPELFKIFLLSIGAGLRRNEMDKLMWKQFDWNKGTLDIAPNEYGNVKTEASAETIDIGADMMAFFKQEFGASKSDFVIASSALADKPKHWHHYRCDAHFKDLITWLRNKGVNSRNPIHTLRKEFGSLINQRFGLFAASAALRHSSISITREHYVDRKERIALDISDLLGKAA